MSTEYRTEPPIKFNDLLNAKSVMLMEAPAKVFITRQIVIENKGSFIYVREDEEGNCEFHRFGINNIHNVFPAIIKEFNVKIFDEYGLEYSECLT
jgi:hypothetical protein